MSLKPSCCGKEAEWIVQSARLQYWYCRECKKEVASGGFPGGPDPTIPSARTFDQELKDFEHYLSGAISIFDDDDDLVSYQGGIVELLKPISGEKNASPISVARTRDVVEQLAAEAREYSERISPDDLF